MCSDEKLTSEFTYQSLKLNIVKLEKHACARGNFSQHDPHVNSCIQNTILDLNNIAFDRQVNIYNLTILMKLSPDCYFQQNTHADIQHYISCDIEQVTGKMMQGIWLVVCSFNTLRTLSTQQFYSLPNITINAGDKKDKILGGRLFDECNNKIKTR